MTTAATDGDLTFDASTNTLNCTNFVGAVNGNAGTATLATNVVAVSYTHLRAQRDLSTSRMPSSA